MLANPLEHQALLKEVLALKNQRSKHIIGGVGRACARRRITARNGTDDRSTTAPVDPQHLGPEANAEKRYLRVLEIDSKAVVAANNLAWLYAEQDKNLDAALDRAQRAKRSLAADPRINDTLGWVYYKKKLLDQAVASLEESVKRDANNPLHQYHLGMAHVQTGDWPQARQALKRALQTPDFSGASDARKALTMRLMACGP